MTKLRVVFAAGMLLTGLGTQTASAGSTMSAGVNLSGLEVNSSKLPGRLNYNYVAPTDKELAYYQSKGIVVIRLPVLWARLQPSLLASKSSTALDPAYLGLIKTIIAEAAARKMEVIIDIHNFGGYATHKIGDGVLTSSQFASFWQSLATNLKGSAGLAGYDLMNEPSNMPSAQVWPAAAQAAVNAIRSVDATSYIFVEGDDWASAASWASNNNTLSISDPASRLIYEAHVYGDRDSSGTHFTWATEAANGVTVNTIAQRVSTFGSWCQSKRYACVIGEIGVGNDSPEWNVELSNGLAAMQSAGMMGFTYWAGGPWWGHYPMSLEPSNTGDAAQMSVVEQYGE